MVDSKTAITNPTEEWSDVSEPNSKCSYTHTFINTPLGEGRTEWKSWKTYPDYCLYLNDVFIDSSFDDLSDAKSGLMVYLSNKTAELVEWLNSHKK